MAAEDPPFRKGIRFGKDIGLMAEWLGKGLQNLVQRFESASDLSLKIANDRNPDVCDFFRFISNRPKNRIRTVFRLQRYDGKRLQK